MSKEDRDYLFTCNREKIEHAYVSAVKKGLDKPVIVAFDLQGVNARRLASQEAGEEAVNAVLATASSRGVLASVVCSYSSTNAGKMLSSTFKGSGSIIPENAPGTFRVGIISDDGISWKRVKEPENLS